ncbi:ABC transporter substrate-binding protein [Jannaschia sp. R86511]|uniref:ABC transporter substrate-binding protein n=1 Tax=Jannaschia sp. R86511 TaxID=3093853 RepID=UPI0036D2A977
MAVALTATACGSDGDDEAGGAESGGSVDTLSVMSRWTAGTPEYDLLQSVIETYTEETGTAVEVIDGGEDIDVTFETAVAAGEAPDVVLVNLFDKSLGWLDAGVTVPVDDYLTEWGLDDQISDQAIEEWRVGQSPDGALQGFPYSGLSWPVWYNTELLSAAGIDEVPETVDELLAAAETLSAAGTPPMIVGGSDWSGQKLFFQVIQTYTDAEEAQTLFSEGGYCDSEAAVEGIELFVQLRDAGLFVDNVAGLTADNMNNTYFSGGAAMMPAGSWAFAPAVAADEETGGTVVDSTVLAGFPVPAGEGAFDAPTIYQGFTGVGFMLTPDGTAEDRIGASRSFIEAFMQEDVVSQFVAEANFLTPIEGDYADDATNPLLGQALTLEGVAPAVLPDVWLGVNSDPVTQVTTLAYGDADPQAICSGLDSATT